MSKKVKVKLIPKERGHAFLKLFRKLSVALVLLVLVLGIASECFAAENVRVLLKQEFNSAQFAVVQGEYQLIDSGTRLPVATPLPGELWTVFREGLTVKAQRDVDGAELSFTGDVILAAQGHREPVFRFANNHYPGDLYFFGLNDRLLVVNAVHIEDYLCGVLAQEMAPSFPVEALKAQAVVSRTLASYRKSDSPYYDLTAETNDQLYRGYGQGLPDERIRAAVDATSGEKIYYDGSLIEAVFHANAGGITASSEMIWGGKRPYLQPVESPYDAYALEYPIQSSGWPANAYEWSKAYSTTELNNRIADWNRSRPAEAINVGNVLQLRPVTEQTTGGSLNRVMSLEIIGTGGTATVSGEKARQIFDLKSSLFSVDGGTGYTLLSAGGLTQKSSFSNLAVVKAGGEITGLGAGTLTVKGRNHTANLQPNIDGFIFAGKGFGHGVGMSQWGAIGMAAAGYNYQEIIQHYYNQGKFDGRLQIH